MKDVTLHCCVKRRLVRPDSVVEIMHRKDRLVLSLCVPALFGFLNDVQIQALVCFSSDFVVSRASLSSILFRTFDT